MGQNSPLSNSSQCLHDLKTCWQTNNWSLNLYLEGKRSRFFNLVFTRGVLFCFCFVFFSVRKVSCDVISSPQSFTGTYCTAIAVVSNMTNAMSLFAKRQQTENLTIRLMATSCERTEHAAGILKPRWVIQDT